MKFKDYLKDYHNMTLYQLANKTGISYNTMQKYSQGLRPSPDRIEVLADALDVEPKELIFVFKRNKREETNHE